MRFYFRLMPLCVVVTSLFLLTTIACDSLDGEDGDCNKNNDTLVVQDRAVSSFLRVAAEQTIDVILQEGNEIAVEVHASPEVINLVKTTIEEETLRIFYDESTSTQNFSCHTTVYVTFTDLKAISRDGTGDMSISGVVDLDELTVTADGTGDIRFGGIVDSLVVNKDGTGDIDIFSLDAIVTTLITDGTGDITLEGTTDRLTADLDGTGDLKVLNIAAQHISVVTDGTGDISMKGTTNSLQATLSSTGDWNGFDLSSEEVVALLEGTGDMEITVTQTLNVTINSTGDLSYKGNPQITQSITGTGDLIDAN